MLSGEVNDWELWGPKLHPYFGKNDLKKAPKFLTAFHILEQRDAFVEFGWRLPTY